jgi:hypothetical protein
MNTGMQDAFNLSWKLATVERGEAAPSDVVAWLRGLGLSQYEPAFRENEIDNMVLPNLTAEDLKDLGIGIVGAAASCSTLSRFCTRLKTRKRLHPRLLHKPTVVATPMLYVARQGMSYHFSRGCGRVLGGAIL